MRAALPESVRKQPSFRLLSEAETEMLVGVELLAALKETRASPCSSPTRPSH
jgi:hypothetical protein